MKASKWHQHCLVAMNIFDYMQMSIDAIFWVSFLCYFAASISMKSSLVQSLIPIKTKFFLKIQKVQILVFIRYGFLSSEEWKDVCMKQLLRIKQKDDDDNALVCEKQFLDVFSTFLAIYIHFIQITSYRNKDIQAPFIK